MRNQKNRWENFYFQFYSILKLITYFIDTWKYNKYFVGMASLKIILLMDFY